MKNKIDIDKNTPHAVFLDIDGTLLSGGKLPPENVTAIREAQEKGHKILLNTGRSYSFIPWDKLSEIHFDGVCAGCGSHVMIDGVVHRSVAVERDFLRRAVEFYLRIGKSVFFEGESACFWVNPAARESANKMLTAGRFPCYEITSPEQIDGEYADMRISKFTYWESGMTREEHSFWSECLRVIEHPTYAESVIYGCDKAVGMSVALEVLGIDRAHSIAMGDSANDTEMLEYAAVSVAMGNAAPETKEICSLVSCDAAEGGVAAALRELLI
ncbi:MAG: HAD hydrolase family protein [Clostridia bacterium]|nr:HAD hydrolase family protein [Clostridia bacterium]